MTSGVSFVVPVHNGRRYLRRVLHAIRREAAGRPFEIIVVDDGSADGSDRMIARLPWPEVRVVAGRHAGAAAALNDGVRAARFPIVCQIDQDVIIRRGWLATVLAALEDPGVAAAQGRYIVPPGASFWARAAGRDLDWRYAQLAKRSSTDHVCTGNVAYRATALHQIGLFDESLGYGYDNDVSYRLQRAGYRLTFCPDARADHHWRPSLAGYVRQQFGVGYGRLDLLTRHPGRVRGDAVSGPWMMLHAPAMLAALTFAAAAMVASILPGLRTATLLTLAAAIASTLALERTWTGSRAWRLTRDPAALAFGATHLVRDAAWAWAIVVWFGRRAVRRPGRPADSMPRVARRRPHAPAGPTLVLIPAYNEARSLPAVVEDIRRELPRADILIINDGSTDATAALLPQLGTEWLTLPQRIGVGGALRAGVRYARRRGYACVARMDGDGQHRARDLARLLHIVHGGVADAVVGSRYVRRRSTRAASPRHAGVRALAALLSLLTRTRVTDPTSGLWVFGPHAIPLLARHHPGGYPEPELRLLLCRQRLVVRELPIRARDRHAGRTSLTPRRAVIAAARTILALLVLPLRPEPELPSGD